MKSFKKFLAKNCSNKKELKKILFLRSEINCITLREPRIGGNTIRQHLNVVSTVKGANVTELEYPWIINSLYFYKESRHGQFRGCV